ncbi:MAG TPA: magnesium-translocating P-type ATPase, partial [Ktedonobacteraceae bacterium]|nr:magnesium-translocating P-type ATPase [Ktedonobacteraceae bacterium]
MSRTVHTRQKSAQQIVHPSPLLREVAHSDLVETLQLLQTTLLGLTDHEAHSRREQMGDNEVVSMRPPSWPRQLMSTLLNPFLLVLVVLGLTSLVTDVLLVQPAARNWTKVLILSIMILLSGLLRFWQEIRSRRAMHHLKALVQTRATVLRRANASAEPVKRDIPITEVVPGDLVALSAGDMVPADVRLLSSRDLFVSQSLLTGEAMPIEKYDAETRDEEQPLSASGSYHADVLEKPHLCFMGTSVISGTATAVVVATGRETFLSLVAQSVMKQPVTTSFDRGINHVSWLLMRLMVLMVPLVFLLNGLFKGDWKEAIFFALAVAVGLTPEMLPVVVTTALAKGAMKMAKHHVIVKHLPAIQHLGALDILCTDKTGTLTEDRVLLVRHLDTRGADSEHVLHLAALTSAYQTGLKNLLDQAILAHLQQEHHCQVHLHYQKLDELPFDFLRRRMSVIVQQGGAPPLLICKGALEEVLQVCREVEDQEGISSLTEVVHTHIDQMGRDLQEEGFRILAVAYKHLSSQRGPYTLDDEQDLVFAGFVAFLDPPKASARGTIQELARQGVAVKVLTGDTEIVTTRICEEVGIDPTRIILGCELAGMSEEDLAEIIEQTTVFARVDPLQKARILRVLKRAGHTVGYMGDGVNDAAALREADVGISVDTAVDIAKEAADIILVEKSLLVLAQGILEGRVVAGNIMKYLKMAVSSNFGNALSLLIASVLLPFLPLGALPLLVQNLLYDLSQLALPWDNVDEEMLARPRR